MFLLLSIGLAAILVAITVIDLRSYIIPDGFNAVLLGVGVLAALQLREVALMIVAFEAVACFGILTALSLAYRWARSQTGLGGGDIKLLTAATAWVGLAQIPWVVLIASMSGLLFAVSLHVQGRDIIAGSRIAFGPHLALGLAATWFVQPFTGTLTGGVWP